MRHTLAWTLAIVGGGLVFCGSARSENFPTRPVTFIVPYAVGGTVDVQLRVLATATEKHLGQAIVIENRPSATGSLGPAHMAATAKPDGYTVTQINTGILRLPFMMRTSYDPVTDFTYIIGISSLSSGLVVRRDAPWSTFGEFLADAKANPAKISYGSPAGGANPHIVMQLRRGGARIAGACLRALYGRARDRGFEGREAAARPACVTKNSCEREKAQIAQIHKI